MDATWITARGPHGSMCVTKVTKKIDALEKRNMSAYVLRRHDTIDQEIDTDELPLGVVVVEGELMPPDRLVTYHRVRLASPEDRKAVREIRSEIMKLHTKKVGDTMGLPEEMVDDDSDTEIVCLKLRSNVRCIHRKSSVMIDASDICSDAGNRLRFQLIARPGNVVSWKKSGSDRYTSYLQWDLDAIFCSELPLFQPGHPIPLI